MQRNTILPALGILLLLTGVAQAQGGYDLSWWTADGGGTSGSGGGYALAGTIGQPDAGELSGGGYTLGGGFWDGGEMPQPSAYPVYLPLIVRG